ncbi:hypothetical protein Bbelb_260840 [Branchiostoma belcheri]|nr:hypothetical protein Bbelb_260840 [Branchiostoma belcheri]
MRMKPFPSADTSVRPPLANVSDGTVQMTSCAGGNHTARLATMTYRHCNKPKNKETARGSVSQTGRRQTLAGTDKTVNKRKQRSFTAAGDPDIPVKFTLPARHPQSHKHGLTTGCPADKQAGHMSRPVYMAFETEVLRSVALRKLRKMKKNIETPSFSVRVPEFRAVGQLTEVILNGKSPECPVKAGGVTVQQCNGETPGLGSLTHGGCAGSPQHAPRCLV